MPKPLVWSYGVTTVPERRETYLPRTLESLRGAGFDAPRLFVDGDGRDYSDLGLEVTRRSPRLNAFGNWLLSLTEVYLRDPHAHRFAIFQDDVEVYRNARTYLDRVDYPTSGYWNLYTFPEYEKSVKDGAVGWFKTIQRGLGALALVFDKRAVMKILSSNDLIGRPQNASRGTQGIDGGVVHAMNAQTIYEYAHYPSLVQHIGDLSTLKHRQYEKPRSFLGRDFDAMELLEKDPVVQSDDPILDVQTQPEGESMAIKDMDEVCKKICEVMIDDQPDRPHRWSRNWIVDRMREEGYTPEQVDAALSTIGQSRVCDTHRRSSRSYYEYSTTENQFGKMKDYHSTLPPKDVNGPR